MIHLNDGKFEGAQLSDEALSQNEPATSLELRPLSATADEGPLFFLRLESEETSVTMYADRELLMDLRVAIDTALKSR